MTIIVSIKINDGIVMASDSAATFGNGQIYLTADKIVNLVKGLPSGVMVTGDGGIGSESISTLLKDLRGRLDGGGTHDWAIDRRNYLMKDIADYVRDFLFLEKSGPSGFATRMQLRLCGYSSGRPLPEIWDIYLNGAECAEPRLLKPEDQYGINWDGEYEPLNRLILGLADGFWKTLDEAGVLAQPLAETPDIYQKVGTNNYAILALPAKPIQDAIDLARYPVETTTGFVRFSPTKHPKSVGGSVEIAAITKHEGFRWVQRRHFYPQGLNVGIT